MDKVKVKYVGPGTTGQQTPIMVTAAEADALEERGLWKRVSKTKVIKKKETSDG